MNIKVQTNSFKKFSIEVMPRTAKKVDDFKRILPEKTTVYVAHLEDTPVEEMFATCKRLISEGMVPMPHIPARIITNVGELEDWVKEYASLGVEQSLLLAGNGKNPSGELFNSIQMLESGIFEKYSFKKIQIAGHPEGNPDIDKDGSLEKTINALKIKQDFARRTKLQVGITTQFCFDLNPVIKWLEILESEKIDLPISLGLAGPTKLQTLIKYAIMCGVGPSISVLKKRAKDLTKLLLPFEPTEIVNALDQNKKNKLFKNVDSLHFFPLGGIEASASFAKNIGSTAA